jgi:excisionase family DNA binding protein
MTEQQAGSRIAALASALGQLDLEHAPLGALAALLTACASTVIRIAVWLATTAAVAPEAHPTRMLKIEEVAARTGMSRGWLYREARAGHLPFARHIGRRWTFDEVGVARWLARRPAGN